MALCTLAEVKTQLNKSGTGDDTELQSYIDAVKYPVEAWCGAVESATVTNEKHTDGGPCLVLRSEVVASVTTLTEFQGTTAHVYTEIATPASAGAYTYVRDGRLITRLDAAGYEAAFGGPVYVTYTAGYATVPADINLAARMIVAEWWESQRGSVPLPLQGGQDADGLDAFRRFSLRRVEELLGHRRRLGGLA